MGEGRWQGVDRERSLGSGIARAGQARHESLDGIEHLRRVRLEDVVRGVSHLEHLSPRYAAPEQFDVLALLCVAEASDFREILQQLRVAAVVPGWQGLVGI